jgi:hypothetical protein
VLHPPKRQRTKEAPRRTGPTPHAPPRRIVSSAAVGETEEAQPFLGANPDKSPIGKRRQDGDERCSRPLKASQTSTFPRIKFVTAGFGEDKYPCCPAFSILGTGGCILPVLSRRECATLYREETITRGSKSRPSRA